MAQRLLRSLSRPAAGDGAAHVANLLLRVGVGVMVFVIHGVHKAVQGYEHFTRGAEWPLVREIGEMGLPAATAQAVAATLVQLVAPLLVIVGFWTRAAGAALAVVLAGALAQNVHAARDPQLALLYLIAAATIGVWGGGRYSVDAVAQGRK